ncbi:MAG: Calcineurin-like phosphoesterase [Candidatus Kentron sp. G]|nr:MAG: Calcineurin-like phosphoesterase [Candidatus Kentron sp. G]VFM98575.1 MAG: Calcineurin-like phosphoesterase [Candidatus Kentron sp. G]VFN01260.1 MAG: Calcineurin-like phosphoesterase [Candidatus Kentron sp. G]
MFTFFVLPDTQSYCDLRLKWTRQHFHVPDQRDCLNQQMQWILENKDRLNGVLVLHEGDLTQSNFDIEWQLGCEMFYRIERHIPYALCIGNHDQGYDPHPPEGIAQYSNCRNSLIDEYFPPARFRTNPLYDYGGNFEGSSSNYFIFLQADGMEFMVITLEFMPRDEVIDWANEVVSTHSRCRCIVLTHGFLDARGGRNLNTGKYAIEGNDGQEIWYKLVKKHENIFLLLCGHNHGEIRRTDEGDHGNPIHQVMANYQFWRKGGNGWMRILHFYPEKNTIAVKTYSPVLNRYRHGPSSNFSLPYPMSG